VGHVAHMVQIGTDVFIHLKLYDKGQNFTLKLMILHTDRYNPPNPIFYCVFMCKMLRNGNKLVNNTDKLKLGQTF